MIAASIVLAASLAAQAPPAPPVAPPAPPPVAAPAPAAGRPLRIAVYELEAAGVEPRIARVVTDALVAETRKLDRVAVVDMDEVKAMLGLEAEKALLGCSDDSCVAEIAEGLGVDGLLVGRLVRVGDTHHFILRRLDQREAKAVAQLDERLAAGNGEEFLALVGPAVERLFPEYALRPSATRGVAEELVLRVDPPPLPTWVFWSGAATTGALLVVGAAATAVNVATFLDAQGAVDRSVAGDAVPAKLLVDRQGSMVASFVVLVAGYGTAAIAGAATGVVALFTDWTGAASEVQE